MVDDLLDFVGDPARTGKPHGKDLLEGKITLPLIHSLDRWDGESREVLHRVLGGGQAEPAELEALTDSVVRAGGVDYALACARDLVQEAKGSLWPLPASPGLDSILALADFVVQRDC